MSDDNFYGVACGMSSANLASWLKFHATHKPDASNPSWEDLMFAAADRIEAAEAERNVKREQILVLSRTTEALQERVEAQRVLIEDLKGDIRMAYLAGATAVHNEWLGKDYLPSVPDFDEAAGDYATAVIHTKDPE